MHPGEPGRIGGLPVGGFWNVMLVALLGDLPAFGPNWLDGVPAAGLMVSALALPGACTNT